MGLFGCLLIYLISIFITLTLIIIIIVLVFVSFAQIRSTTRPSGDTFCTGLRPTSPSSSNRSRSQPKKCDTCSTTETPAQLLVYCKKYTIQHQVFRKVLEEETIKANLHSARLEFIRYTESLSILGIIHSSNRQISTYRNIPRYLEPH